MIANRTWRLRTALVALLTLSTLATLVTLVVVGGGLLLWRVPQLQQESMAQVQREAQQLAERMELLLGNLQHQLEQAAITIALLPENPPEGFLDALTARGHQAFEAAYVADRNGIVELVSVSPGSRANRAELLGSDVSANRLYRDALQHKGAVWSGKFLSALSGSVTVGATMAVGDRVLIAELPLDHLLSTVRFAAADPRLSIWIIDSRGELVAEAGTGPKLGPTNVLGLPMVQAALGALPLPDIVTIRDREFHPAVARSSMVDWHFLVLRPAGLNNPDIRFAAMLVSVALLSSLLIGALLAPRAAEWISRPMRAITDWAGQVASGKPSGVSPRGTISELNALAVDLETMAKRLQERQDQLREAQRIAGIGSWEWAVGSDAVRWSEGLHLILGRDPSLGTPTFATLPQCYTPGSWQRLEAAIASAVEAGVPFELELEMIRADGTICWTITHGEAVRGPDGAVATLRGTALDITELKQAQAAVMENERLLSALFANLPGMAYRCINDKDWTMTTVSQGCKAVTGYEWSDLHRNRTVSYGDLIHPEDRDWLWSKCQTSLDARTPCDNEYRIIAKSGDVRWVWERAEGFYAADGTLLGIGGFVQDITERKRSEEKIRSALAEKEVLLKEIYHRVKNNLQVVSSLLNLQSRRVPDGETKRLLDESANRVKSMALVHEQLYRAENLSSIGLREYLLQLADNLKNVNRPLSTRVVLRVEAEELFLAVESAIPLGLVVNELVSNAYRHGYQSDEASGEIVVRVTGLPGGQIRLEVKDDGCGLPADFEPGKRGSLGVQLVATLSQQLGGELTWDVGHQGTCVALLFKPETPATRRMVA